jgi:hypothetical protein
MAGARGELMGKKDEIVEAVRNPRRLFASERTKVEVLGESAILGFGAGIILLILLALSRFGVTAASGMFEITVAQVISTMAIVPFWLILAYEYADQKWIKDIETKYYNGIKWYEGVLIFLAIMTATVLLINLVYIEIPVAPLIITGAIIGVYIATPNTGDDYFLFMAWVACSIIAMGMGWISPAAWAAYQVVIPAKIGALTGNKPISINPINIPINLPW